MALRHTELVEMGIVELEQRTENSQAENPAKDSATEAEIYIHANDGCKCLFSHYLPFEFAIFLA
jgi:hypothetical protein